MEDPTQVHDRRVNPDTLHREGGTVWGENPGHRVPRSRAATRAPGQSIGALGARGLSPNY